MTEDMFERQNGSGNRPDDCKNGTVIIRSDDGVRYPHLLSVGSNLSYSFFFFKLEMGSED